MPSIDEYLRQLADEARRQGATPEESWRADLGRIYQGSGGQGARTTEDMYRSLFAEQARRGRPNAPREQEARGSDSAPSSYSLPGVPVPSLPTFQKPPAFQHDPYRSGLSLPTFQTPPAYTAGLSLPTFTKPAPFRWPSVDEVLQDPSYQWRKQQGEESLQRWVAAKGTLNDSSTATGLIDYGQHAATQEYGAIANRARDAYATNYQTQHIDPYRFAYQGALDAETSRANTYQTNYQTQHIDPYRFAYQGALDTEDRRFQGYMANRAGALTQYNTNYGTQYVDPYRFDYQRESDLFAPQMEEWRTGADFRNLRYGTDAAARLQSQQLGYTDSWNRYLAQQQQDRWEKDFGWKVSSQD